MFHQLDTFYLNIKINLKLKENLRTILKILEELLRIIIIIKINMYTPLVCPKYLRYTKQILRI